MRCGPRIFLLILLAAGCGKSMPTEPAAKSPTPTPPLDVSGSWNGTATSQALFPCSQPAAVVATLQQSGADVRGSFKGGCLDGKTFEGQLSGTLLTGQTKSFLCSESGATTGTASPGGISMGITVYQNLNGGCLKNLLYLSGTVTVGLAR